MHRSQTFASLSHPRFESRQDPSRVSHLYDDSELDFDAAEVENRRRQNDKKLQGRFESIFAKYAFDFGATSDEIDLVTGAVIVNNGHLKYMRHERDVGQMPQRRSRNEMQPRITDLNDADDERVPPPRRRELDRHRASVQPADYSPSEYSEDHHSTVPQELAIEVVQNAVPTRNRLDPTDPDFLETFNRNIVEEITRVMHSFQTPQARFRNSSIPQPMQESSHSVSAHKAVQSDLSRDSPPRYYTSPHKVPTKAQDNRMEWEQSLWDDENQSDSGDSVDSTERNSMKDRHWRVWSEEEDQLLIHLRTNEGLTCKEISRKMRPRSYTAVLARHRKLHLGLVPIRGTNIDGEPLTYSGTRLPKGLNTLDESDRPSKPIHPHRRAHANIWNPLKTKYVSPNKWNLPDDILYSHLGTKGDFSDASPSKARFSGKSRCKSDNRSDRESPAISYSEIDLPQQEAEKSHSLASPQIRQHRRTRGDLISYEDDLLILNLREERGLKWREIAPYFPKRTADVLANRYNTALKVNAPKPRYRRASPELGMEDTQWSRGHASKRRRTSAPYYIAGSSLHTGKSDTRTDRESIGTGDEDADMDSTIVTSRDDIDDIRTSESLIEKRSKKRKQTWDEKAKNMIHGAVRNRWRHQNHEEDAHAREESCSDLSTRSQSQDTGDKLVNNETSPSLAAELHDHSVIQATRETSHSVVIAADVPTVNASTPNKARSPINSTDLQPLGEYSTAPKRNVAWHEAVEMREQEPPFISAPQNRRESTESTVALAAVPGELHKVSSIDSTTTNQLAGKEADHILSRSDPELLENALQSSHTEHTDTCTISSLGVQASEPPLQDPSRSKTPSSGRKVYTATPDASASKLASQRTPVGSVVSAEKRTKSPPEGDDGYGSDDELAH